MAYYYSVTQAGTADQRHGPYSTQGAAVTAGKLDANKRGYSSGYHLTIYDGNEWNSKIVYEEDTIPNEMVNETVYYYILTSQDTARPGSYGNGETFGTEQEARDAMAKTIRLQQIKAYNYQIQKWNTGDKSVTVIESNTVLPEGWGKGPTDPDVYYYRISSDIQPFEAIVSKEYATYKEMEAAAISQTLDYRYNLKRGKVEFFKRPGGTVEEKSLGIYCWGEGKYPANWKLFDDLVASGGDSSNALEDVDWTMWAAIATVIMVIIMAVVFMKSKGAASG